LKTLLLFTFVLFSSWALAQNGGIPSSYMNDPAVDLAREGRVLFPDEVHELKTSSRGRFDISLLNPVESSDLWKNTFLKELPVEKIPLADMDEVKYHSPVASTSGIFRFNIQNQKESGKLYTMMLSKSVHTILLAKSLLRKIGYQIPDVKRLPRVVVKFSSEAQKKSFISYLENVAFAGSHKAWVIEDLGDRLIMQDLVVMESTHIIYNLAVGVTFDMIQGRRLLSSLAVPLTIVNLNESINMLRWNAGVVNNKQVMLFHDQLDQFQCTWDDARWITRRIEKLSREDWKEIVDSSELPKGVRMILLEKLISRRNSVMKLFKIDAEEFKVESKISNGVELVDGKLTQEDWPGFASRFAHGDPHSPLAPSEMKSLVKSRLITSLISGVVGQINQLPYLGTDIKEINTEHFKAEMEKSIQKAIAEKKPVEVPVKSWVFPTFRGQLILSRNLVAGTYLGTDKLLQLVDTVGVAVAAGAFAGTMGLPSPLQVYGAGEALLVRSYAHLRPVFSIDSAMKYKFKNIFVPLVKQDYGKKLHEAINVSLDPNASEEVKAKEIEKALKPFKDSIEVGESLIVTDSLATYVGAQVGAGFKKLLTASLGLVPGHMVVSRFHVHRRSEDEFQIYKDKGHNGSLGLTFDLDSLVPLLDVRLKKNQGHAKVKYYSLFLNPKDPKVLSNASALRRAIVGSTTSELEDNGNMPFVIKHAFKEYTPQMNVLFWQFGRVNSSTDISIENPQGDERYFRRHYYGGVQGRNYQAYSNALISHWVKLLFDRKASLADNSGRNPGDSFKGRAVTKYLTLDQEVSSEGEITQSMLHLSRIWNGWSVNKEKAKEILDEMKHRYRYEFYNAPVLNDTRQIFLYRISLNMNVYQKGLEHLLNLDEASIKQIFLNHKSQKNLVINPAKLEEHETGVDRFLRLLRRHKNLDEREKTNRANKYLLKAVSFAEANLYVDGMAALVGGMDNLYIYSRIEGFREGDEDGDRTIVSNTLGEIGSPLTLGPIVQMQRQNRLLEGEFFIYWMMTRLI
jgi:hypothetical protein